MCVCLFFCSTDAVAFITPILVLALALVQYIWIKLSALAVRLTSLTALEVLLLPVLLSSPMQEYVVKVWRNNVAFNFILEQILK